MKNFILECCVDRLESAKNAIAGGADRLELCGNLVIGGTTPSLALYQQIRREVNTKIHVLIRPRFGDFCYTEAEIEEMESSICQFREVGADAVVIGVLQTDGSLNRKAMRRLITAAGSMKITLHRAFDMCRDPFQTLEDAVSLGVHTILTSGQAQTAWEGRNLLKKLIEISENQIDIMAGSGVNAEVIEKLQPYTKGRSFHMSGKVTLDSPMCYRKQGVSMGMPGLSEYEIWQTSMEHVKTATDLLKRLEK